MCSTYFPSADNRGYETAPVSDAIKALDGLLGASWSFFPREGRTGVHRLSVQNAGEDGERTYTSSTVRVSGKTGLAWVRTKDLDGNKAGEDVSFPTVSDAKAAVEGEAILEFGAAWHDVDETLTDSMAAQIKRKSLGLPEPDFSVDTQAVVSVMHQMQDATP